MTTTTKATVKPEIKALKNVPDLGGECFWCKGRTKRNAVTFYVEFINTQGSTQTVHGCDTHVTKLVERAEDTFEAHGAKSPVTLAIEVAEELAAKEAQETAPAPEPEPEPEPAFEVVAEAVIESPEPEPEPETQEEPAEAVTAPAPEPVPAHVLPENITVRAWPFTGNDGCALCETFIGADRYQAAYILKFINSNAQAITLRECPRCVDRFMELYNETNHCDLSIDDILELTEREGLKTPDQYNPKPTEEQLKNARERVVPPAEKPVDPKEKPAAPKTRGGRSKSNNVAFDQNPISVVVAATQDAPYSTEDLTDPIMRLGTKTYRLNDMTTEQIELLFFKAHWYGREGAKFKVEGWRNAEKASNNRCDLLYQYLAQKRNFIIGHNDI